MGKEVLVVCGRTEKEHENHCPVRIAGLRACIPTHHLPNITRVLSTLSRLPHSLLLVTEAESEQSGPRFDTCCCVSFI
jgi:hypothetical protein